LSQHNTATYATVTFAIYDETPIACQGNDDGGKIQVVRKRLQTGEDLLTRALRQSLAMAAQRGTYVQVWEVSCDTAEPGEKVLAAQRLAAAV
jgi:hypothetical protein